MKQQNLGQKTYLIVQNPFPSIENYKNSRTLEKFKNTKVKNIVFQEQFKNRWNSRTIQGIQGIQGQVATLIFVSQWFQIMELLLPFTSDEILLP